MRKTNKDRYVVSHLAVQVWTPFTVFIVKYRGSEVYNSNKRSFNVYKRTGNRDLLYSGIVR